MPEQRLQKILARCGVASRRKSEALIADGRVTVNGRVASLGDSADPQRDAIKLDGKRLKMPVEHRYYLLWKPDGYVATRSDPQGRPTVYDLLPQRLHKGLVPVGRLDFHSEGLLLMTDDGDFAQRVSHPSFGCRKRYEVKVRGVPSSDTLARLRRGIKLGGRVSRFARITRRRRPQTRAAEANSWWIVELVEGRNRQIREMFQRVGHPVQRLRRVAIGPLTNRGLKSGAVRELTSAEVRRFAGRSVRRGGGRRRVGPRP